MSKGAGVMVNRRAGQRRPVFRLPSLLPWGHHHPFLSARLTGLWHLLEIASGEEPSASLIKRIMQEPHSPPDRGSQNFGD